MQRKRHIAARAALASATLVLSSFSLASIAQAGPPPDGSVGKADNKAPGGQWLGDHNKGYECDENPGVGNGNPAHTSNCDTTTTTSVSTSL